MLNSARGSSLLIFEQQPIFGRTDVFKQLTHQKLISTMRKIVRNCYLIKSVGRIKTGYSMHVF